MAPIKSYALRSQSLFQQYIVGYVHQPITIQHAVIYTLPPPSVYSVTQSSLFTISSFCSARQLWVNVTLR